MNPIRFTLLAILLFVQKLPLFAQPADWKSAGPGGGGALFAPAWNPAAPNEIFVASDLGALFQSTSAGQKWTVTPFQKITAMPESRMQFTSNPAIRYCLRTDGNGGIPVKTPDGGNTWADLPADPTGADAWTLHADPSDPLRLLVSGYAALYFSKNGGATFQSVHTAPDLYIGGVFWDGPRIFVGCRSGLLVSTDGGTSFSVFNANDALPTTYGMLSLAGARASSGAVRLFCTARANDSMWPGMQGSEFWAEQGVFRMDWGNPGGWQRTETGIPAGDFPFYVGMAANDPNTIYAAGATEDPVFPAVWKSSDGGANWQNVFQVVGNQNIATGWQGTGGDDNWWWGGNAMGFAVAPGDSKRAVITDFGFIHLTTDGGLTWRQAYVDPADQNPPGDTQNEGQYYHSVGMEQTTCWDVCWSDAQNVWTSYTDIGASRSRDGGASWSFDYVGNDYNTTYRTVKHPGDGRLFAAVSTVHDLYQSTYLADSRIDGGGGEVLFSQNKGAAWQTLHDFGHPVVWVELDPNNPNVLYASVVHSTAGGIYVTKNLQNGPAATWTRLPAPLRTEGHPFAVKILEDGSILATFSGRRNASGAFTTSSGVFLSQNGGASWSDRSDANMLRWTKDIVVDPHDAAQNTWYACVFSHWGAWPNEVGGLYRTVNRGLSWEELSDFYRVESCTVHPDKPGEMYVTTETEGLWRTANGGAAGQPDFSLVEKYPFHHPCRVFYNPLNHKEIWVSSFGNGLRIGDETPVGTAEAPGDFGAKIFPQPAQDAVFVELENAAGKTVRASLCDVSGRPLREGVFSGQKFEMGVSGISPGIYFLKIRVEGGGPWVKKVVKQ